MMKLLPFQREFIKAVENPKYDTVAISGPRTLGKTFIAAQVLIRCMTPGDALHEPGKEYIFSTGFDYTSIEDLLLATLDAVSRFRVGQRDAVSAALEAGALLTEAKGRLQHGEWGDWLHCVALAPHTASMWLKLAGLGLTAEDVIERGGIVQTLRGGNPKSATVADLEPASARRIHRRRRPHVRQGIHTSHAPADLLRVICPVDAQ